MKIEELPTTRGHSINRRRAARIVGVWSIAVGTLGTGAACAGPANAATNGHVTSAPQWPMFSGGPAHTGYFSGAGPSSANLKWKFRVTNGSSPAYGVAVGSDGTVFVTGNTSVDALTPSGVVKWSRSYPAAVEGPSIASDGTVYITSNQSIVALNPSTGAQEWSYATGGTAIFDPTVAPDGTVIEGSWDGYLYALNPNGSLKWKFQTHGAVSYPATVGADGTVYLGGGDAHAGPDPYFYVINGRTGALITSYNTGKTRVGTPVLSSGGTVYVPAQPDLYAFSASGSLLWHLGSTSTGTGGGTSGGGGTGGGTGPGSGGGTSGGSGSGGGCAPPPAPCAPGGGTSSGGTGTGSGSSSGTGSGGGCAPPPAPCAPGSHSANAVGTTATSSSSYEQGIIPPAIGPDGTLYNGTDKGTVFALNPVTRTVKWTYQTGSDPTNSSMFGNASFPLVDSHGTLYIGADDDKMYAIDKNGKVVWTYTTGGHITESSPAFASNGTLYFTSADGYLYVVGTVSSSH